MALDPMAGAEWETYPVEGDVSGLARYIQCVHPVGTFRIATLPAFPESAASAVKVITDEITRRVQRAAYAANH